MDIRQGKCVMGAVLWTAAIGLGVGATVEASQPVWGWCGLVALVAACVSGLVIAEYAAGKACRQERIRIETLAQVVMDKAREQAAGGVDRIHPARR